MSFLERIKRFLAKTLYERHPELEGRVPIFRAGASHVAGAPQSADWLRAAGFYQANVWQRRAVELIANTLAPLPLQVLNTRTQERRSDHEVVRLFEYVNSVDDSIHLWKAWTTDLLLSGEAALELVLTRRGRFGEVWARTPDTVTLRLAEGPARRYGGLAGYRIEDGLGEPYLLDPEELIFCKFYNPLNRWRGLSPVAAIRLGLLIDEYSRAWSALFFKKAARPDVAVIAPQGTTRTEKDEIERRFKERYSGDYHGVVVLEEGLTDVKPIDYPPVDTQWLEQRRFSRSEIMAMYGVPEEIAGFGKDTYENFETALKVFYQLTIQPLAQARDAQLTEHFRAAGVLRDDERLVTDYDGVAVLQENRTQQITDARALWEMGTPANQAFEVVGLTLRIAGGDTSYLPFSVLAQRDGTDAPLRALRGPRTKVVDVPLYGELHQAIWERKQARIAPFERATTAELRRQFRFQEARVAERLRERAVAAVESTTAISKTGGTAPLDLDLEMRVWMEAFRPLFERAVERVGLDAFAELGMEVAFDLDRPEVRAQVDMILEAFARKVLDTTYTELGDVFRESEQAGETLEQLMERLVGYWEDRTQDYQLERIARTVMTSLNNAGDMAAWGQTNGAVIGKLWLATFDERVRDAHAAAHGQKRRLYELYDVGGERLAYPGDPVGSAGNVINCRCSQAPVLRGESVQE